MKDAPALVEQLLDGMTFPHDDQPRCSDCWAALEGAAVIVCARRVYDAETWELNSVWCREHAPEAAPETPYGKSVLATARVGTLADVVSQTHEYALVDAVVVDTTVGNGAPPPLNSDGNAHSYRGP